MMAHLLVVDDNILLSQQASVDDQARDVSQVRLLVRTFPKGSIEKVALGIYTGSGLNFLAQWFIILLVPQRGGALIFLFPRCFATHRFLDWWFGYVIFAQKGESHRICPGAIWGFLTLTIVINNGSPRRLSVQ